MNYDTALKLKVIGLNQDRRTGSQYYITPDILMNIEDIGYIKSPLGITVDITPFVFKPNIEHVLAFLGRDFGEVRRMVSSSEDGRNICAFAFAPLKEGRQVLRAFGEGMLEALANLALAIYEEDHPVAQSE